VFFTTPVPSENRAGEHTEKGIEGGGCKNRSINLVILMPIHIAIFLQQQFTAGGGRLPQYQCTPI